ncbi:unnamed protein product [Durusdinium trenchii]|uniref:Uncharacterized protein n=1 Tax=Durusdinium trenchii TaxID=1381693 RepID=A0ABP0M7D4_9DINO
MPTSRLPFPAPAGAQREDFPLLWLRRPLHPPYPPRAPCAPRAPRCRRRRRRRRSHRGVDEDMEVDEDGEMEETLEEKLPAKSGPGHASESEFRRFMREHAVETTSEKVAKLLESIKDG